jgi:predicted TIM-barrel fold metal-dependent hydrolase
MAEACARSGGRLVWLATVSPLGGKQAAHEAARAFRLGARGVGELNADAQGFDFREPVTLGPVVEACLAHDRPMMVHATEPVGHAYPGKGTATPDRLVTFLEAYPALRVVAAHWGGGLPFYELMPEVKEAAARVVYDSAATTYLYRFDVFRIVVDLVGPERVMFASDYPILRQDRLLRRVQQIPWRGADEPVLVLGETARRVYQIEPVSEQQQ